MFSLHGALHFIGAPLILSFVLSLIEWFSFVLLGYGILNATISTAKISPCRPMLAGHAAMSRAFIRGAARNRVALRRKWLGSDS